MTLKFTIGTDPEFFLRDRERNGMIVSAHDIVPGNKKNPVKLPDGSHVQADGTAVEFNIEPATSGKEFADKVKSALNELRKIIPAQYEFYFKSHVTYNPTYFKSLPESAKELGCDPDYYAFPGEIRQNQVPTTIGNIRTGSGHIHIGWTKNADTTPGSDHWWDAVAMINQMEIAYNPYTNIFDSTNYTRQKYYGGPLAFRCKPYGAEYRTPSNHWLNNLDDAAWFADMFLSVANKTAEGKRIQRVSSIRAYESLIGIKIPPKFVRHFRECGLY